MSARIPFLRIALAAVALPLVSVLAISNARADDEGQEDLDQATEAKLSATSSDELGKVIDLAESALKKGLDERNTEFAEKLLGSAYAQRGSLFAEGFFQQSPRDPKLCAAALEDLEKAVKLDPQQAMALYFIARLNLLPTGNQERATEAIEQAIERLADQPVLQAKLYVLRSGVQKDPAKKLADIDEAIRLAPNDASAWHVRALMRAVQGKLDEAMEDLDQAIKLAPNVAANQEIKATLLLRMRKLDEALAALDKAQVLNPKAVGPLLQKAQIHVLQKDLDAALKELDRALEIQPDHVGALFARVGIYRGRGEKEKALADVQKVVELQPDATPALRLHAVLLAENEKYDEAIEQLEKLHKLEPDDVAVQMQLGIYLNMQKQHDRAIELFTAILAGQPENWAALRGRGDAKLNSGDHEAALADYEAALKLRPKDPGILNNLAWVLATSPTDKLRDGRRAVERDVERRVAAERDRQIRARARDRRAVDSGRQAERRYVARQ